jgi:hypothetical protein
LSVVCSVVVVSVRSIDRRLSDAGRFTSLIHHGFTKPRLPESTQTIPVLRKGKKEKANILSSTLNYSSETLLSSQPQQTSIPYAYCTCTCSSITYSDPNQCPQLCAGRGLFRCIRGAQRKYDIHDSGVEMEYLFQIHAAETEPNRSGDRGVIKRPKGKIRWGLMERSGRRVLC